ncbi:MAG TPA: hypothetical protein VFV87_12810 [Pirellulaceae bacterium]|nr:hypothetical protein [Pirellulaceae bacterium]
MFRFSLRDLLWLTLVAAILCAWWIQWRQHVLTEQRDAETIQTLALQAQQNANVRIIPIGTPPGIRRPRTPGSRSPAVDEWDLQAPPEILQRIDRPEP